MTKRVLVVGNGCFGSKSDFQYMMVDIDGQYKDISKYHRIEGVIHSSSLAKMVEEIFEENKCDEIHIDALGTGLSVIEHINEKYYDKIVACKCDAKSNHEAILDMMSDIRQRRLFMCKDSIDLYDILEQMGKENTIYYSNNGLCKIGKDLEFDTRRKIQLVLGLYMCLRRQCRLCDDPIFKDRYKKN